ncbi:D-lactate dehydrogenase [Clostridium cavendishii DSM 21758]|uniref:D-lactate dehydrogenase n=1 Tax=Clostridium cavendishii DSM 21758 TaxID=1121302 RepID=A0A1M6RWU0_9CLOT|nr:2-hydroxyacid dehydrogenase [Clostridium cavendishii]SHK36747.1 D-lactate dehydrogenase [Clostridium cavendishii DSM 21758]
MLKLVCYGVRDSEVEYFHKLNEDFGYDLELVTLGLNDENVTRAVGADAVMVRGNCKAHRKNLEFFKQNGINYVLTRTVGFDHVDLEAAKKLGIKVARVPGYSPNAISELAVTLSMMLLRHTAYTVDRTSNKNFIVDGFMFSKEVRNCTVGVLGAGRIGLTTASLFKGLGAKVIAYDVFQSDAAKEIVEFKELDEVLKEADIISVHMPYLKGINYHIINEEFISKMKDGAILVNTARGELQDMEAIINAVETGKLGGFGTDVLEGESAVFFKDLGGQTLENPLFEKLSNLYPKVLITPHMGSYTDEALRNMISISYENLKDLKENGESKNQIA